MIYKTFNEWKNGNYLEDLEPRKKAYTRDELLLIEMGWNYGHDAGVEAGAAAEREECATVAESYEPRCDTCPSGAANAIRARGQE